MYQMSGILILWFVGIFFMANAEDGESIFLFPGQETDEHVNSLQSITSKQALPVILFGREQNEKLHNPMGLIKVEIKDGRLASGTKFFTRPALSQMFFCPDTSRECLVPKQFEASEKLECDLEPIPTLKENPENKPCGATGTGTHLRFSYEICPAKSPYSYKSDQLVIYSICYDEPSKKVLSVGYEMSGASMTPLRLLKKEADIEFEMNTQTYGHINADYYDKLEAEAKLMPDYRMQMLVPIDDMALAYRRKPINYFANFALQHVKLMPLWDYIRMLIRNHNIEWFDRTVGITTRVFDIPKEETTLPEGENQLENIWITLIMDNPSNSYKQMAILMNNFIVQDSSSPGRDAKASKKLYIDEVCGQDLCLESLKQKFKEFDAEVRCCQVNKTIASLFTAGVGEKSVLTPILHIDNIN